MTEEQIKLIRDNEEVIDLFLKKRTIYQDKIVGGDNQSSLLKKFIIIYNNEMVSGQKIRENTGCGSCKIRVFRFLKSFLENYNQEPKSVEVEIEEKTTPKRSRKS